MISDHNGAPILEDRDLCRPRPLYNRAHKDGSFDLPNGHVLYQMLKTLTPAQLLNVATWLASDNLGELEVALHFVTTRYPAPCDPAPNAAG